MVGYHLHGPRPATPFFPLHPFYLLPTLYLFIFISPSSESFPSPFGCHLDVLGSFEQLLA